MNRVAEYSTEAIIKYDNQDAGTGPLAFVRHNYTNYEELLLSLPKVTGRTREEIMSNHFRVEKLYQAIKIEATELARKILQDAYGNSNNNHW
jgi:hypothetical protein